MTCTNVYITLDTHKRYCGDWWVFLKCMSEVVLYCVRFEDRVLSKVAARRGN